MTMRKHQKGAATLFISLVILLLVTLNVFIGAKSAVIEQKSANNLYRTEEAFQNAEAGVAQFITASKAFVASSPAAQNLSGVASVTCGGKCQVSYSAATSVVTSVGTGSGGASRTITQRVKFTPSKPGALSHPVGDALTALGGITIGGSADVSSVKSGGTVTTTGSGKVGGASANPDNAAVTSGTSDFKVALLDYNNQILTDANGNTVYRSMTTDEYFMLYFGDLCPGAQAAGTASACKAQAKAAVQASSIGYVCSSGCTNADLSAQYSGGKRWFWMESGGMKINANITLGSTADPVLILVMNSGTVQINGTSTVFGVVYVDVPDTMTTQPCSCTATASALASHPLSLNRTKYVSAASGTSGALKCTTEEGCTDTSTPATTISQHRYYLASTSTTTVYDTSGSVWGAFSYALTANANNDSACTAAACSAAVNKCVPPTTTSPTSVSVSGSCSFVGSAVSGSNNTPVEIDVLGTWDNSGGGNALIQGAALTSGNFSTTGGINLVRSVQVTQTFQGSQAGVAPVINGWSDLN